MAKLPFAANNLGRRAIDTYDSFVEHERGSKVSTFHLLPNFSTTVSQEGAT